MNHVAFSRAGRPTGRVSSVQAGSPRGGWSTARRAVSPAAPAAISMAAAHSRVIVACGPSVPDALRGRPTTSSVTSFLATTSAIGGGVGVEVGRARRIVASGRAAEPSSSAMASPMRRSPRSMPSSRVTESSPRATARTDGDCGSGASRRRGRREGDGRGATAQLRLQAPTVTVTRLPNDGMVPIQSGHTETSTVPNGARMDSRLLHRLPEDHRLQRVGIEDGDLLSRRRDRELDGLTGRRAIPDGRSRRNPGTSSWPCSTSRRQLRLGEALDGARVDGERGPCRRRAEVERLRSPARRASPDRQSASAGRGRPSAGNSVLPGGATDGSVSLVWNASLSCVPSDVIASVNVLLGDPRELLVRAAARRSRVRDLQCDRVVAARDDHDRVRDRRCRPRLP